MKKISILFSITILSVSLSACIPSPPNPGFRIETTRTTIVNGSPVPHTDKAPNISLDGNVIDVFCCVQISGNIGAFNGGTNSDAYYDLKGGKTPAHWRLGEDSGPCAGQSVTVAIVFGGSTQPLDCRQVAFPLFAFSPSTIERDNPPASVSIDGSGISSVGGMPTLEYYNMNGTLIAQDTAIQVAEDGSWLSAPLPSLSLLNNDSYVVIVRNPDGNIAGNALMVVFDYYEPPGCNPSEEQVSDCEMAMGHVWNYDTCRCEDMNP